MIDPLGPDPSDPAIPPRKVGEIVSDFEASGPIHPRVRHANYDSPEALVRHAPEPEAHEAERTVPLPKNPPVITIMEATPKEEERTKSPAAAPAKPAQTALARPVPPLHKRTKLEKAIGVAKTLLPLVGKMLPLLEGNVVGAATNLLAQRPVEVDLKPLEEAITKLQSDQRALTFHTGEQKRALRRVEDELETLQETVQKNAEVQAEIAEHLAKLAKRAASFNRLIVILLVVLTLFTALLCVRIAYILHP